MARLEVFTAKHLKPAGREGSDIWLIIRYKGAV